MNSEISSANAASKHRAREGRRPKAGYQAPDRQLQRGATACTATQHDAGPSVDAAVKDATSAKVDATVSGEEDDSGCAIGGAGAGLPALLLLLGLAVLTIRRRA